MKSNISRFSVVFLILMVACSLFGQTTFKVAADSSSGTYNTMLGQIISVCSTDDFVITPSNGAGGGAVGNLDALKNNKVDAAFLHSDVYIYNANVDPDYNRFKTLIAGWPEPIHVLVLRNSKTSKPGFASFGKLQINTLSDLIGPTFKVGAAGGGVKTASILSQQGGGNFQVLDMQSGAAVIPALDSGQVDAVIFVGAAPLPNFDKINKANYKLVPIGESISGRVSNMYRAAKINYPTLTNGPITTLAPIATLLSKSFSTPEKVKGQAMMRKCVAQKLGELQDTGAPNWADVTANDHGIPTIPWLELPTVSQDVAPVSHRKK